MKLINNLNIKVIVIFFLILSFPIFFVYINNIHSINIMRSLIGTLGVSIFIYLLFLLLSNISVVLARIITICLLFFFFFIRLTLGYLYDFTGKGFTGDFFAHFGLKSFLVGFDHYKFTFVLALMVVSLLVFLLVKILVKKNSLSIMVLSTLILSSSTFIFISHESSPELNLLSAYSNYKTVIIENRKISIIRDESSNILESIRATNKTPIEKHRTLTKSLKKPKNIIILYLESFSNMLTENSKYPGLTPNLDSLKNNYTSFTNNYSSAYVTIEGIANSQCGTLLNMENDNNSLTGAGGRVPHLPCLGDILHNAGYKQFFFGGADLAFAGKGAFLTEHGYDEPIGILDWRKKGFKDFNEWGLSDAVLFKQATAKILELKKENQPFNLTLLTLGTHLPGFSYEGCSKYNKTNNPNIFLDAIHCTDFLVGEFIRNLIDYDVLSDTVVYIQGDHAVFPTREMKNLFDDKFNDKRVLTIVLGAVNDDLKIDTSKTSSSLNLVANVLDLLDIEHNVDFILARSDFNSNNEEQYVITRYNDYYKNNIIESQPRNKECNLNLPLPLPLNSCDKTSALNALYGLINSYSHQQLDQKVCQLGVSINVNNTSNEVTVQWGNKNLSQKFYYEGRVFNDVKKGFYLLNLDAKDQVISSLFYSNNKKDLKKLNNQLSINGSRFLLLSNLNKDQLSNLHIKHLDKSFNTNKSQYSKIINGNVVSLFKKAHRESSFVFVPNSCEEDIENLTIIQPLQNNNLSSCEIIDWGPKQTVLGSTFLEQPNGYSAFWLKTNCVSENVYFRINGNKLNSVVNLPVVTASIDDTKHLITPGIYNLDLYSSESNSSLKIGDFKVIPNNDTPLYVPNNGTTNTNTPPLLIAHAGGSYKNQTYLNSIDALNYNYSLGHRTFELDFNWTNDNQLVGIHDWENTYAWLFNQHTNKAPSLSEFKQLNMKGNQSQITLFNLDSWLSNHPDAFIVTDIKGNNIQALKLMAKQMKNAPSQIIPQMYHPANYEQIMGIGYNEIIFTLYATTLSVEQIIDFSKSNKLYAVTIHPSKTGFNKIIKSLSDFNVFTYVHTFNTIAEMKSYLSQGVNGIYTDFLYINKEKIISRQNKQE